jgi:hypothetical protein
LLLADFFMIGFFVVVLFFVISVMFSNWLRGSDRPSMLYHRTACRESLLCRRRWAAPAKCIDSSVYQWNQGGLDERATISVAGAFFTLVFTPSSA